MFFLGIFAAAVRIQPAKADLQDLTLSMSVNKTYYDRGELVAITFVLTNTGNETVNFGVGDPFFDFIVTNSSGLVFQYSLSAVWPMYIIDWSLGPGENLTQVLSWTQLCNQTAFTSGTQVAYGMYSILGTIHSIDFQGLQAGPVEVTIGDALTLTPLKTVVAEGRCLPLNVTIFNSDGNPETLNVTLSCNETAITTDPSVNASTGFSTVPFTWNTTNFPCGNYLLSATAGNLTVETSIALTIPGDVNGDFKIDLSDLVILANAYGTTAASPQGTEPHQWNPNADMNGDGVVNLYDLVLLATHYSQHC
jgi:hypothetical protein